jgi:hypothetical protein
MMPQGANGGRRCRRHRRVNSGPRTTFPPPSNADDVTASHLNVPAAWGLNPYAIANQPPQWRLKMASVSPALGPFPRAELTDPAGIASRVVARFIRWRGLRGRRSISPSLKPAAVAS